MEENFFELQSAIKSKLVKKITFDILEGTDNFNLSLNTTDFAELEQKAKELNVPKNELLKLINKTKNEITLEPKIIESMKVIPYDLPVGQHVKLITNDGNGEAIEEFIHIKEGNFILINHERGSLLIGDHLKSVTSPWNINTKIDFEIYRNGERFIKDDKYSIYRSRAIAKMYLLYPQFDFEISED